MIVVLLLVVLLATKAPESCKPGVAPLAITHQVAPIDGVPVLFDGVAVTVRCHL